MCTLNVLLSSQINNFWQFNLTSKLVLELIDKSTFKTQPPIFNITLESHSLSPTAQPELIVWLGQSVQSHSPGCIRDATSIILLVEYEVGINKISPSNALLDVVAFRVSST
ncbi:hypothetical protein ACTFIU_000435 [Dictyostelium citrinum]